ncbi:MAG: GlxA family transcriptional regulator, partial [Gammaproteobacteria bacterium]
MLKTPSTINICLVAVPETVASILIGLHDLFKMFDEVVHGNNPFKVTIAGLDDRPFPSPSGIVLQPHCGFREIRHADIIIVPALLLNGDRWVTGRYDGIVRWMRDRHGDGALLCSACSGILLQAETGLYDNYEATLHWAYAEAFQRCFPKVKLRLEKTLLSTGSKNELIMSGGSSSWHDLALYLVARAAGPAAANSVAKFFLLQWHEDGQAPYIVFDEKKDHGDGAIL